MRAELAALSVAFSPRYRRLRAPVWTSGPRGRQVGREGGAGPPLPSKNPSPPPALPVHKRIAPVAGGGVRGGGDSLEGHQDRRSGLFHFLIGLLFCNMYQIRSIVLGSWHKARNASRSRFKKYSSETH